MQEAANKAPLEVSETKEDLDIAMAAGFRSLCNCADPVQLHFLVFRCDNEPDKADPLHLEFALRQLQVEACLLKLCEDKLDMLSVLLKQVQVDKDFVSVGYAKLVYVFPWHVVDVALEGRRSID